MPIPVVPFEAPDQTLFDIPRKTSPFTPSWWMTQIITDIPADAVGWLVAQGWQITSVRYEATTTPPTAYFTMQRETLQNWIVLQSLLNEYTIAYNDAQEANSLRYKDVVRDWTEMIESSQLQFEEEIDEQNEHVTLYLGNLDTYMTEVDDLIDANQAQLDTDITAAAAALTAMDARVHELEQDYTVHAITSPQYLVDLGATELARINEQFAASLAVQMQQLVDRGLYSSIVATDIRARNLRDRNQEIVSLKDRLNREKLDNEHKLYAQLVDMKTQLATSKERYSTMTMARTTARSEDRHRAIIEKMNEANMRLAGLQGKHEENMKLLAYQLDERNKLLIGIYGFVERREDRGPEFQELTRLLTSLSDAGGGWVTP